ncbi:MAG TPA: oligosaccharide flippase family protein [Acidimicrobiales bacterium]|nr:oligosaccharide flippase family protein [Acidimicrobiales bacterium]
MPGPSSNPDRGAVARAVAATFGANTFLSLVGASSGVLSARVLGVDGRGALAAIQNWPMLLAVITLLGLPEALVFFTARRRAQAGLYLGTATGLALLAALPLTLAGWLLMPRLLASQTPATVTAARWYLLIVPLFALSGVGFHALRGVSQFVAWNMCRLLGPIGWLVLLLFSWQTDNTSATGLSRAYVVVLAGASATTAVVVWRNIKRPYGFEPSYVRPLLRFGIPSILAAVPQMLNLRLDQLIMAGSVAPDRLGLYVTAVAWGGLLSPITSAIGTVMFPILAGRDRDAQESAIAPALRATLILTGAVTVVGMVGAPALIPVVFGKDFAPAVPSALILSCAGGVLGLNFVLGETLRGLDNPTGPLRAEFVGLAATAVAIIILVPRFDIVGAAAASLVSYTATFLSLFRQLERSGGPSLRSALSGFGLDDVLFIRKGIRHLRPPSVHK